MGQTLLTESASVMAFCETPPPEFIENALGPADSHLSLKNLSIPSISKVFDRSRTPSPEPALTLLPPPPTPRRMVMLVVGLKPHRKLWSLSARPSESVINYILLNGCPAIVIPVKVGAPLVAWDALTLEQLWEMELPTSDGRRSTSGKFEGVVDVIFEYLDLCVDWDRVKVPVSTSNNVNGGENSSSSSSLSLEEPPKATLDAAESRELLKDAITVLVAAAIRSKTSKEARNELDADRSGIAMWRIP